MQNCKTKTNTNPSPDPNRYRRHCPDPNARIQKFIHYMAIATFAIAPLCDSGLSPITRGLENSSIIPDFLVFRTPRTEDSACALHLSVHMDGK